MNLIGSILSLLYCIFYVKKLKFFKLKLIVFPSDKNSFLKE